MVKFLIGFGIIFLIFPIIIDTFFIDLFVTHWDKGEWAGFLGSYLGGGVSGVIALVGIYYQLNEEKKYKERETKLGILKYVKHVLNENLNDEKGKNDKFMKDTFIFFSYKNFLPVEEKTKMLIEINSKFIDDRLNHIFDFSFGGELYNLKNDIINFNNTCDFLSKISFDKEEFYNELEKNKLELNIKIFKILSDLLVEIIYDKEYKGTLKKLNNEIYPEIEKKFQDGGSKKIKNKLEELIDCNDTNQLLRLISDIIINVEEYTANKLEIKTEISKKFLNYRRNKDILYTLNIFKIFEEMEDILDKIEKEINKIEKA